MKNTFFLLLLLVLFSSCQKTYFLKTKEEFDFTKINTNHSRQISTYNENKGIYYLRFCKKELMRTGKKQQNSVYLSNRIQKDKKGGSAFVWGMAFVFLDKERVLYISSNKDWLEDTTITINLSKNIYRDERLFNVWGQKTRRMQGYYEIDGDKIKMHLENHITRNRKKWEIWEIWKIWKIWETWKKSENAYNKFLKQDSLIKQQISISKKDSLTHREIRRKNEFEKEILKNENIILTLICKIDTTNQIKLISINEKENELKLEDDQVTTYDLKEWMPFDLIFKFQEKKDLIITPSDELISPSLRRDKPKRSEIKSW